jgi:Uma2 family endonuclease
VWSYGYNLQALRQDIIMSFVAQRLLTAEEYWQSPLNTKHSELVRGEVVETMPPSKEHGTVALKIGSLLLAWAERGQLGQVGVESGFILARDPDSIRGPDVYYVSAERAQSDNKSAAFWTIAPDLAVEVVSPSESASEIREKVRDFLAAGTPLVWVVFPSTREVIVHTTDGLARTYGEDDLLENQEVLTGFSCRVAELFD